MKLHINQQSLLLKELTTIFPNLDSEKTWSKLRNIELQDYKYLLSLCYHQEKIKLDSELFKLGVYN